MSNPELARYFVSVATVSILAAAVLLVWLDSDHNP
jgi:hypothetical protein